MQHLSLQQAADYLESATIESTQDTGFALVHIGISAAGVGFVMVNDCQGRTVVTEAA